MAKWFEWLLFCPEFIQLFQQNKFEGACIVQHKQVVSALLDLNAQAVFGEVENQAFLTTCLYGRKLPNILISTSQRLAYCAASRLVDLSGWPDGRSRTLRLYLPVVLVFSKPRNLGIWEAAPPLGGREAARGMPKFRASENLTSTIGINIPL